MKKLLLPLFFIILMSSCKKNGESTPAPGRPDAPIPPSGLPAAAQPDTIADGAMVKIRLQLDSAFLDETLLKYQHSAPVNYSSSLDAVYFQGFGQGSLSSRTHDGVSCCIQAMPFVPGGAIPLTVTAQHSGVYLLKASYTKDIPEGKGIWLKDAYRKDSLNIRLWGYRFDVIKSDTNSFGAGRFTLVVR